MTKPLTGHCQFCGRDRGAGAVVSVRLPQIGSAQACKWCLTDRCRDGAELLAECLDHVDADTALATRIREFIQFQPSRQR